MSDTPVSEPTPAREPEQTPPNASSSQSPSTEPTGNATNAPTAATPPDGGDAGVGGEHSQGDSANRNRRRRGSRGGRNRSRPAGARPDGEFDGEGGEGGESSGPNGAIADSPNRAPERPQAGAPSATAVRPQIGDSRPAPVVAGGATAVEPSDSGSSAPGEGSKNSRRRRGGRGRGQGSQGSQGGQGSQGSQGGQGGQGQNSQSQGGGSKGGGRSGQQRQGSSNQRGGRSQNQRPVEAILGGGGPELDEETLERRKGRERNGRPVGRYLMTVSVRPEATQIAVLEGRNLIEHFVSKPADDVAQIHGNIYLGKVQNVLPGMEAAFVDISTPKNAVLYRGDVQFDAEEIEGGGAARIEQILRAKQPIICQVTKNPIAHKGARLTQEVSLPGRFVVLIPNSSTYGISKRLADDERRRLRSILDKVKPPQHGVIVRTAAEGVTSDEISADVRRLLSQWEQIESRAASVQAPALLYREPDMALRVIREEFNDDYRGVIIDDPVLFGEVHDYVSSISPALADRVQYYDRSLEPLSIFERHHVHEQLHKALDRKVWLPSGGSLIIEHTEALTVVDVNTGKNVGSSNLEETVYRNNLEAAVEIAKQLRLRDVGGIIVIDFIDMEIRQNRDDVIRVFRDALARDKTRTQVFDISELGLVEMTRKRIGEGLLESFAAGCPDCEGRGVRIDGSLLG
ncbi:MAG: Rne/Rng family ribonuclease [Actinobacteria bacterium]|uniref:Unannotated protein n=1 Tax=freshwater metagenome TaxID=449393 RepID=A0A6J7J7G9_9ZZZZ|nr:Rne/Rng family ribonuclease [Actinomycetota bacterium]